jgi:hypothetical protein
VILLHGAQTWLILFRLVAWGTWVPLSASLLQATHVLMQVPRTLAACWASICRLAVGWLWWWDCLWPLLLAVAAKELCKSASPIPMQC